MEDHVVNLAEIIHGLIAQEEALLASTRETTLRLHEEYKAAGEAVVAFRTRPSARAGLSPTELEARTKDLTQKVLDLEKQVDASLSEWLKLVVVCPARIEAYREVLMRCTS